MKYLLIILISTFFCVTPLFAERTSENLNNILKIELSKNKIYKKLILDKKLAIGVINLSGWDRGYYLNEKEMIYAASIPKIAILYATFIEIKEGKLKYTPEIKASLNKMIKRSDNTESTKMIRKLGGVNSINKHLVHTKPYFYDLRKNGGLWVGREFVEGGEYHVDPVHNITHGATIEQVCRFYYLLYQKKLINRRYSKEMLNIMSDTQLTHKFMKYLWGKYDRKTVYRKSGTWSPTHADSVMVIDKKTGKKYICVVIIKHDNGAQMLTDIIRIVDTKIIK